MAALPQEPLVPDDEEAETEFATYEDYLDSQIKPEDMFFLGNEDLARQLVELGQRGSGDTMTREEFEHRKREMEELKMARYFCIYATVRTFFTANSHTSCILNHLCPSLPHAFFASQNKQPKVLCHQGKDLKGKPLLSALAAREEDVRNGKLTVRNSSIVHMTPFDSLTSS